ncbi:uncharacterized protein JCM6883_006637 [Sporobolomyces salmoneus]|uniref:uncharacterized protein n=1 Tax=Sporobolomyces salmoneus TaxID=183962 RepID=UPI00316CD4C8
MEEQSSEPNPSPSLTPLPATSSSPPDEPNPPTASTSTPSEPATFPPPSQSILSAPPVTRSLSTQSSPSVSSTNLDAHIYGIALVGFDHALGPNVEFLHPSELESNSELKDGLPFLALPDGAHARDEDYTYFHLHLPNLLSSSSNSSSTTPSTSTSSTSAAKELNETVFGISCNRQIMANELLNKGKEVTRSTVQKAIVVLASKPIFGPLRDKLGVITRSFFAQRDFQDKSILIDLYQSFQRMSTDSPKRTAAEVNPEEGEGRENLESPRKKEKRRSILGEREDSQEEEGIYMGTFLRELVHKFRFKTLMLLKLLMLQRRVLFYSTTTTVEQLCTFQYSLVALIPALLTSLQDSASPLLANRIKNLQKPTSLKTSDKGSLIRYLGLPLEIFGEGSFFQPYLPLQQIDMLGKSKTYLVGTTNSIIQQQRDCNIDVVVNLDTTTLQILNQALVPLITLTPADRKWMDELVTTVDQSWNKDDPTRPEGLGWIGSEDFLRGKFEEYVCSLLACVKFGDFLEKGHHSRPDMLLSAPELESYNPSSFNESFIKAFKQTRAFDVWDKNTDEVIFDLVEPKHPMEGKTNPFEDVGIRLVSGLHDLHLPENLLPENLGERFNPTREAIQRGLVTGSEGIWGAVKWAREEAGKRQRELQGQLQEAERERNATIVEGKEGRETTPGEFSLAGGVDVAQKGAATVAAGLGGLWGKARNSALFASTPSPTPTQPPTTSSSSPNPNSSNRLSANDTVGPERPPSPTPSIVSTTSSNKSSSLVTVQAQLQAQNSSSSLLTTPPTSSNATFLSTSSSPGPSPRGLKPLSTAAAAAPASPSTGSATLSSANSTGGGLSAFFGGIRRSFIEPTSTVSNSAPSTTTTNGKPSPAGGGGPTRGLTLPTSLTSSFGNWSRPSSSVSTPNSMTPATSRLSPSPSPSSLSPIATRASRDEEGTSPVEVRDVDLETGEEIVVLRVRDLDQERRDEEERQRGVEEARKKLEGTA